MTTSTAPQRIDAYPTHSIAGLPVRAGHTLPFGATPVPGGVNFSVYSNRATAMTLVLFSPGEPEPLAELRFPEAFRIGGVYAMTVFGIEPESVAYAYRADGPFDPAAGDRFDPDRLLVDPYATMLSGHEVWRGAGDRWLSRIAPRDFDWEGDQPLRTAAEDLVVYEVHVRGFTAHPTSGVRAPGTFAGLVEKIPYLRSLGVNCVELMPVFEFDELDNVRHDPTSGAPLVDYWGYSTVGFFAPKVGYAATGRHGMQVDELKQTVKQLHRAGIEVMLDVVFNHTAEGDGRGPTLSFRGMDNHTYYVLTEDGGYANFSGAGNTVNCNHPVVRGFVLDCLRYWATEFHVDGFRFDAATILGRSPAGDPLADPPLLEAIARDPVLRDCKLVAEAWDAGGLSQVGTFPDYCRWAEWNPDYRDTLRRYLKGDQDTVARLATRFAGSPDLYSCRGPAASVNFATSHDSFTLRDLVSYNDKHNEDNGENNRDGGVYDLSWNCGHEGPSTDEAVEALRDRQVRNALLLLLTSHGIPMLLAGDEAGRTQRGNNNAYCHDDELTWFDWSLVERDAGLVRFVRHLIAFRKAHPCLRGRHHPTGDAEGSLFPEISWHGVQAWQPDWSAHTRLFAAVLCDGDDCVYVAANAHWEPHEMELPRLPSRLRWHVFADTAAGQGRDSHEPGTEPPLLGWRSVWLAPRSAVALVARPTTPIQHEE